MPIEDNYRDQSFLVTDPDARIRRPKNLMKFKVYKEGQDIPAGFDVGDYILIPKGTRVSVTEVEIGKSDRVFALATSTDGSKTYGWTSTRNFAGQFKNVTLGLIKPAAGATKKSNTATWRRGKFTGQVSLIKIVDSRLDIEQITKTTARAYFSMLTAANAEDIDIFINSGFRTYAQQEYLFNCYKRRGPGCNLAAKPGHSNHQSGIALDISVAGGRGNPTYDWLREGATKFGFIRTVKSEVWHWEYRPTDASKARNRGSYKLWV